MILKNKCVLVYGLGDSGLETVKFLLERKAKIFVYDDLKKGNVKLVEFVNQNKIKEFDISYDISKIDFVVISPGIYDTNLLKLLSIAFVPIINEIELAARFIKKSRIVAVTGTNGKTTTVSLIEYILTSSGKRAFACGNIGTPLISLLKEDSKDTVFVVELSSFQLERLEKFSADISVLLNITPDHLNRHKNFDTYKKLKLSLANRQKNRGYFLFDSDLEAEVLKTIRKKRQALLPFGEKNSACYLEGENIFVNGKGFLPLAEISADNVQNLQNYYAAILVCTLLGLDKNKIAQGIKTFVPAAHRNEFVAEILGVKFINDSKATNPSSTCYALQKIEGQCLLLLGGSDKGYSFEQIFEYREKIKHIFCYGQTSKKIFDEAKKLGFKNIKKYDTFKQAVLASISFAKSGDTVLLSPACASFDEFESYKERGALFKRLVNGNDN